MTHHLFLQVVRTAGKRYIQRCLQCISNKRILHLIKYRIMGRQNIRLPSAFHPTLRLIGHWWILHHDLGAESAGASLGEISGDEVETFGGETVYGS